MPPLEETMQQPLDRARAREAIGARLTLVYPPELRASRSLDAGGMVIGRKAGPDGWTLDHPTVSRRHLQILWDKQGGHFKVSELGSRNGSRVDGVLLQSDAEARVVGDNSVIRAGDVLFVLEHSLALGAEDASQVAHEELFGQSAAMVRLRADVACAAPDPSPVVLIGETGTGKERVARELHRLSGRSGPFLAVNCAALSPQLIESQLFGHKKGAFTGAQQASEGLFRAAQGGSLFLDEIGELPSELQPKLLRVLQEHEVHPVGEAWPVSVDVRVISATLRDLPAAIEAGRFRLDLYARLSAWEVRVPPLKQRRVDVLGWLDRLHALWLRERNRDQAALELPADVAERVLLAPWPENLRALERLVHRACSQPQRSWVDIVPELGAAAAAPSAAAAVAAAAATASPSPLAAPAAARRARPSREELVEVLRQNEGSVRATAKHFQRDRRQIYRWMDLYELRGSDDASS